MDAFILLVMFSLLMLPVVGVAGLWMTLRLLKIYEPGFGVWLALWFGLGMLASLVIQPAILLVPSLDPAFIVIPVAVVGVILEMAILQKWYKTPWKKSIVVLGLSSLIVPVVGISSSYGLGQFFAPQITVADDGMAPALRTGDKAASQRFVSEYLVGDLVEVRNVYNDTVYVRRIVAVPKQRVEVREGKLYVDGALSSLPEKVYVDGKEEPLSESYRQAAYENIPDAILKDDEYLVLADNPEVRKDDPAGSNRPLRKKGDEYIKGKVVFEVSGTNLNDGISWLPLK